MTKPESKCRLCLKGAELCKSHVIPEFFYEQMKLYDSKHRCNILSTKPGRHFPPVQKGIRERLLCKGCEGKFSEWENYARRALYGGECIEITTNDRKGFECTVGYRKYKLFQLSILWRVGISTQAAFSSVELGKHEDVLRRMLHGGEPGATDAYGCVILRSTKYTDFTSKLIHCAGMSSVDGVDCVTLLLDPGFWVFLLSESPIDPRWKELFLQDSRRLRILKKDIDPNGYIERLALDFYRANPRLFDQLDDLK